MHFIRYRVVDADGTFLDEFATNAPDFAEDASPDSGSTTPGST
jgi:hypothetical protein